MSNTALDRRLRNAEATYLGQDDTGFFKRASRVEGDVDSVAFQVEMVQLLRKILAALERGG